MRTMSYVYRKSLVNKAIKICNRVRSALAIASMDHGVKSRPGLKCSKIRRVVTAVRRGKNSGIVLSHRYYQFTINHKFKLTINHKFSYKLMEVFTPVLIIELCKL